MDTKTSYPETIWPIRIKFGMRFQSNEALSDHALHLYPHLWSDWGTVNPQIWHYLEKSCHTQYQAEWAETDMNTSWNLCSPLGSTFSKGTIGCWTPKFVIFFKILFVRNYPSDSVQIWYGAWGRWILLRFGSSSGSALSIGLWAVYSQIQNFLQKPYCQKSDWP